LAKHVSEYKRLKNGKTVTNITSFQLFDKYDVKNCRIELIELFPCNSKDELTKKEGEYIRVLNCVNRCIAGRTSEEWHKQYYEQNKDIISEKKKIYRDKNKDAILEYQKIYNKKNKEIVSEKKKNIL
jgi:hypothetical protein